MRVFALAMGLGACFSPQIPEGLRCSEGQPCPPEQSCVQGSCQLSAGVIFDAANTGADAAPVPELFQDAPIKVALGAQLTDLALFPDGSTDGLVATSALASEGYRVIRESSPGDWQVDTFAASAGVSSVVVGEFSGQGPVDLAIAHTQSATRLSLATGIDSPFGFTEAGVSVAGLSTPSDMLGAEFTNDGVLDLVLVSDSGASGAIVPGTNGGGFAEAIGFSTPPVQAMTVADLNGDSRRDIIIALRDGGGVAVRLQDSGTDASFPSSILVANGVSVREVLTADIGASPDPDLLLVTEDETFLVTSDGSGSFETALRIASIGGVAATLADLDGDGLEDLAIVGGQGIDSHGRILLRSGAGFEDGGAFPVGDRPIAIVAGDFDGDTRLDLASIALSGQELIIALRK